MTAPTVVPSRELERDLLRTHRLVAGMDEVGRGALAGPVTVGVAVVSAATTDAFPDGLADSKLLTARAREGLAGPVRAWCHASAVAHAEPAEIDALGIVRALRLAGRRALAALGRAGLVPDVLVLDGVHDWLTEPAQGDLLDVPLPDVGDLTVPPVRTCVKADATCAAVAAASVLAKVERDARMRALHAAHEVYGWANNKGYGTPAHAAALRGYGPSELHRRSWNLPGHAEEGMMEP